MRRLRFVPGNRVTLLETGSEYFPALEAALHGAAREVHLQTYIFRADATGRRIADALKAAAARGVAVRLLLDGFGSHELPAAWREELLAAGVQLLFYRPELSLWRLSRRRLRRLHHKLAVVDQQLAFAGGINIVDDIDPGGPPVPRLDYAVAVEGPLVAALHGVARRLWLRTAWLQLQHRWAAVPRTAPQRAPQGAQRAALVVRDNLRHRRAIEQAYLEAIGGAEREIIVANAYFLPGRRLRRALAGAARRGLRVVLLLQGRVEYVLQHSTRTLYGMLLDAGVEIHEYRKGFLHAKVAVVDGRWSTVGSSNIDPLSLLHAREANLAVDDAAFAARLREGLLRAIGDGATRVEAEPWRRTPWPLRAWSWLVYGVVRAMVGLSGYRAADW